MASRFCFCIAASSAASTTGVGCTDANDDIVAVRILEQTTPSDIAADAGAEWPPIASSVGTQGCGSAPVSPCASRPVATAFQNALCTCGALTVPGVLSTDIPVGLATSSAPYASVGADGDVAHTLALTIAGNFTAASPNPVSVTGEIQIAGTMELAGGASTLASLRCGGDAWLQARVSAVGRATIGGSLHLAQGASLDVLGVKSVNGATTTDVFAIQPPCPCATEQRVDIGNLVTSALAANDDAMIGLASQSSLTSGGGRVTLPCGAFYVDSIGPTASVELDVEGRASLFVGGDATLSNLLSFHLAAGAQIDIFIRGNFALSQGLQFGDPARPGATRIYVLGSSPIRLPGSQSFAASLYAPNADVTVGGQGDVYGALFAHSVGVLGGLAVHYDPLASASCTP